MIRPRLVVIYGFAGLGKTTLAKRLNQDLAFSLYIEGDEILKMIGQWLSDEDKAREKVFMLTLIMAENYLRLGHDVIVPCLLLDTGAATELEKVAKRAGADFIELEIKSDKQKAIDYLFERGTWGESKTIAITEKDRSHIEEIYDMMERAMKSRIGCKKIPYFRNNIDKTYSELKNTLR
jgi:predicted kinase